MSLFEWFSESRNPGPVGKIEVNPPDPEDGEPPKKWLIYLVIVIGLFLTVIALYWVVNNRPNEGFGRILIKLGFLVAYVAAGYFIRPVPDTTNLGLWGGLINNPFRISDDYNRYLATMKALLLPGRIIAYSLVMTSWMINRLLFKVLRK